MATPPPPYPQPCPEFHRFGPTGRSLGLSMGSGEVLPDLPAYAGVWEVVRSYPISLPMLEYVKWCGPTRSPCTCWSVLGVVQPDHPTFPAFGLATFNQPPFSFLLPSWDLMIPHGSGQRMTRKHSSSPVVAGGNSGGKPHG